MLHSIRARLTLWHTAMVAIVLITFSGISYALLARSIRTSTDASIAATAHEFASVFSRDRAATVPLDFRYSDRDIFVFSKDAGLVASSASHLSTTERARVAAAANGRGFITVAGGVDGDGIRLYRDPIHVLGSEFVVVAAQDLDPQADRLEDVRNALLLGIPLALVIAAAGGYLLARKALTPVAAMSEKARQIGAATLDERIDVENPRDELGHLAGTFNDLLQRLERAFDAQRHFMADASHELRTPISIILGEAGVALNRPERARAEYRESIRVMQKAALKLTRIVHNIFLLARTDAGSYPVARLRFYLDDVVAECVRGLRTVAAAKNVEVACEVDADLVMSGDEELIQHLVQNLVENAMKFTPEGGRVHVSVRREGDAYVMRVRDSGKGIAPADQPFIFDRFFRASRSSGGAGLGLAIARWIADAHDAALVLEQSSQEGSTFRVTFRATESRDEPQLAAAKGER